MPGKHIIVVHERSTKPQRDEKLRYVRLALLAGLRHVSSEATRLVDSGTVPLTLAYYGDLNNTIMIRAQPEKKEEMVQIGGLWFEPDKCDDEGFEKLTTLFRTILPRGTISRDACGRACRIHRGRANLHLLGKPQWIQSAQAVRVPT